MRNFTHLMLGFSIFAVLCFFHFRGLFYPDEGYVLNTASRMLSGEIPYKDFDFVYTPATPLINLIAFSVLGESIISSRVFALLISSITVFMIFRIVRLSTKSLSAGILSVLLYLSWGPSHINFIWPSIISLSIGIFSIYSLQLGLKKESYKYIVISGFLAFLVFLTKQNLGIAVVLSIIIFSLIRLNLNSLFKFIFGALIGFAVFMFYLIITNSHMDFLRNFYENLILKIIIEGTITTPLIYDNSLYSYLKLLFYISPLLISIYSFIINYKDKSFLVSLSLFSIFFYLAGFRPVTDYVHLAPLIASLSLSLIPLFISKSKKIRLISHSYALIFIIIGFYTSLFFGYYKWEPPLTEKHKFLNNPKVNMWVSEKHYSEISLISEYVNKNTNENDSIFINYYSPMIYFLLSKSNPTSHDYISEQGITVEAKNKLISDINSKEITLILTHDLNSNYDDVINKNIVKNYVREVKINGFTIWKRDL